MSMHWQLRWSACDAMRCRRLALWREQFHFAAAPSDSIIDQSDFRHAFARRTAHDAPVEDGMCEWGSQQVTTTQEFWSLIAAAALGGATVGFAVAIRTMRSHGDRQLRLAVKEANHRWAPVVERLRAERIRSELQLAEARISLGRVLKTASDQARSAASHTQPKPPEVRTEGGRINVLLSPFLGREIDHDPRAFAETQPLYD